MCKGVNAQCAAINPHVIIPSVREWMTDVLQSTHTLLFHASGCGRPVCHNHKLNFQRVRVWTAAMLKSHVIIPHTRVWRNYELQSSRWEPQYHESVIGFWAQSIDIKYSAFEILKSNPKWNPKWWSNFVVRTTQHIYSYINKWGKKGSVLRSLVFSIFARTRPSKRVQFSLQIF